MFAELKSKSIFDQARSNTFSYMDGVQDMDVFPNDQN